MNKPILAAIGLAGACVACCSIPIAFTLLGGVSAAGLAGWVLGDWTGQIAATALAAVVIGTLCMWKARRAKTGGATEDAPACSTAGAGGCGCGPKAHRP
jgi:membrane protein implicated in regulation of membrane protease activity